MSIVKIDQSNQFTAQRGIPQASQRVNNEVYNLDLLDLVKRKFWFILFFVLLGLAASLLYFFKAPKTYEATARVFVDEKNAPVMNAVEGDPFIHETSIEQYLLTIKSTKILAPAIQSGRFQNMVTFQESDDILLELRDGQRLSVKPADTKSSSGVIELGFQGPSPEECKKILDEILDSFHDHITSTTKNIGGETAALVGKVQTDMLARLREVEDEIGVLSSHPELLNIEGRIVNPHQMQLSLLHQDLHDVRRERTKLIAKVENIKADQAAGKPIEDLTAEILQEASEESLGAYVTTHSQYVELKVKQQDLMNQYGPDHPDVIKIQNQIVMVDGMRMQELSALRSGNPSAGHADGTPNKSIIDNFISQMSRKIAVLGSEEKSLADSIEKEQHASTSISALVEKLNALQRERERLEQGCAAIFDQLTEVNTLKEHLWRNLSVLDPPNFGEKVAPSLPISLAGGLFLGSLAGLAFAGVKDVAEKTFRSDNDVAGILATRVVGHVALFQKSRSNKRNSLYPNILPEVVAIHNPASQPSEAYRAIRTSIYFKTEGRESNVIQVTSPTPSDGKSTTISNLAASIAQSGRRVLLIDCDLRKPVQHKLFGISNSIGLTSILNGDVETDEAIQIIQPEFLSVIAAGPLCDNPAEMLTSEKFASVIQTHREKYDFVLLDSPPMLAVTDPSIICGHVDQLYMVLRIRNGVRTNSLRAKEIIDSMGVELSGVIISGIRRRDQKTYEYSGQYGYGTRTYGGASGARPESGKRIESLARR